MREAAAAFIAGAKKGVVRTRSGDAYKPSVVRSYEEALRLRVLPELGALRLADVRRADVQRLADRLVSRGLGVSTVRNTLVPLRSIFRRAFQDGVVAVNPTERLRLPAVRGVRDRVASPDEAAQLLAALPERERALWATAMYAGLRRGELMALRWEDVDFALGVIRVERSWDMREGAVAPKSRAGKRSVPIASALREHMVAHRLRSGRAEGLAFGRDAGRVFDPATLAERAKRAWSGAGLAPITLHECRHTFASLMIAAGVNAKALCTYMGHSTITVTIDRYGHLFPGNENEAAHLLDAYLHRASV